MDYVGNLPDVSQWQPKADKQQTLGNALMITCQVAQRRIVARAEAEIAFNVHSFDSGPGVEDIVREELANLLPGRYCADPGVVNDRLGNTAGDCDVLVRDPMWSPIIKPGATDESRRFHFPIEAIYAAAEIKQTLGLRELDAAMEKLVTISRLERPENPYGHITENQHIRAWDRPGAILNPLHTTVVATRLRESLNFEGMARRFGEINAGLDRNEMVKMLCVLDHGAAWYSVASGTPLNATYMEDRQEQLVLQVSSNDRDRVFYHFYVLLAGHLNRSTLGLSGVHHSYGDPPPPRNVLEFPGAVFNQV